MADEVPKAPEKLKKAKEPAALVGHVNERMDVMTGKLLETAGVMHTFTQSLQTSGFKDYVDYLGRPVYSFFFNLSVGIARGFGFVIGATVVVALFVYVLTQYLVDLPYVGDFFQFIQTVITDEELKAGVASGQVSNSLDSMFQSFKSSVLGK
ncbi:MAG: DUF5665 domain-containing protein [Candidatus Gracilibacteria bacterium]|nr:DUF5665 domain-containing protein [Candidatus Gracilibacteria bacterium]